MQENRLLRRIAAWNRDPTHRGKVDPKRTLDSVREYLQKILNTRQGSVPLGEDFGLPDFVEMLRDYPESVREFERTIRATIQKYEPRLKTVKVRLLQNEDDPLTLRFQIAAKLVSPEHRMPVMLESVVDQDGKVSIAG